MFPLMLVTSVIILKKTRHSLSEATVSCIAIFPSRSAVFNLLGIVALSAAFAGKVIQCFFTRIVMTEGCISIAFRPKGFHDMYLIMVYVTNEK